MQALNSSLLLSSYVLYETFRRHLMPAYYSVPFHKEGEKLPCVANFHGGGGKGSVMPAVLATGVCCFAMDVRSQGGQTADKAVYEAKTKGRNKVVFREVN